MAQVAFSTYYNTLATRDLDFAAAMAAAGNWGELHIDIPAFTLEHLNFNPGGVPYYGLNIWGKGGSINSIWGDGNSKSAPFINVAKEYADLTPITDLFSDIDGTYGCHFDGITVQGQDSGRDFFGYGSTDFGMRYTNMGGNGKGGLAIGGSLSGDTVNRGFKADRCVIQDFQTGSANCVDSFFIDCIQSAHGDKAYNWQGGRNNNTTTNGRVEWCDGVGWENFNSGGHTVKGTYFDAQGLNAVKINAGSGNEIDIQARRSGLLALAANDYNKSQVYIGYNSDNNSVRVNSATGKDSDTNPSALNFPDYDVSIHGSAKNFSCEVSASGADVQPVMIVGGTGTPTNATVRVPGQADIVYT